MSWAHPARPPRRSGANPFAHHGEPITVTTPSGYALAVTALEPRGQVRATAVLLHSMMASRRIFHGPPGGRGLAEALVDCKIRVFSLDFRGHGDSTPGAAQGGRWDYDDLVREDLPCLVRAARARWPSEPVFAVGHSLGAHVALASAASGLSSLDGLVLLAGSVWLEDLESHPVRRAEKAALLRVARGFARVPGYLPARSLGLGSDDEAGRFILQTTEWWWQNAWTSRDGSVDYGSAASRLKVPVLAIASAGDTWESPPDSTARFVKRYLSPSATFELVRRADDGGSAPDHMGLVTTRAALSTWNRIARFCAGAA